MLLPADLNPSTRTALRGLGDFQPSELSGAGTLGAVGGEWSYAGRNVAFSIREHAMGAAVNGGVLPFSAIFLTFSDYMKPAIRLGALSGLKAIYIFTHDSIGLGEDGRRVRHASYRDGAAWTGIPQCERRSAKQQLAGESERLFVGPKERVF